MSYARIYLAGKCGPNDWRGKLLEARAAVWRAEWGKRGAHRPTGRFGIDDGEAWRSVQREHALDLRFVQRLRSFDNVGPFPVDREHPHYGVPADRGPTACMLENWRTKIHLYNNRRMERADMLFAYINEPDCYGTIAEIGAFSQLMMKKPKWKRRPLGICFGPDLTHSQRDDLWSVKRFATVVCAGPVEDAFEAFLDRRL